MLIFFDVNDENGLQSRNLFMMNATHSFSPSTLSFFLYCVLKIKFEESSLNFFIDCETWDTIILIQKPLGLSSLGISSTSL